MLEGEEKEAPRNDKKQNVNKQKLAKKMSDLGKAYIRPKTAVAVPARTI